MNTLAQPRRAEIWNKVPAVTAAFWIIKVLATTVGETAADFLNVDMGFGLPGTAAVTAAILAGLLWVQMTRDRYAAAIYWPTVVLVSIAGTLLTDWLVDDMGVSLVACAAGFGAALAATFLAWWKAEGTLSIHSIVSARREGFYWLAILSTFALGTAAGDLAAEGLSLGFATSAAIFGGLIALTGLAYRAFGLNGIAAFWIAYVLTRPLGASLGDLLSQPVADGGLGLGATSTTGLFLAAIFALVGWLAVTRIDLEPGRLKGDA